MAEKLQPEEIITFKELLIAEMIEIDTITQLLIEKGIISREEYFDKLKEVRKAYEEKRRD